MLFKFGPAFCENNGTCLRDFARARLGRVLGGKTLYNGGDLEGTLPPPSPAGSDGTAPTELTTGAPMLERTPPHESDQPEWL